MHSMEIKYKTKIIMCVGGGSGMYRLQTSAELLRHLSSQRKGSFLWSFACVYLDRPQVYLRRQRRSQTRCQNAVLKRSGVGPLEPVCVHT